MDVNLAKQPVTEEKTTDYKEKNNVNCFGTVIETGKERTLSVTKINDVSDVESPGHEQNAVGIV